MPEFLISEKYKQIFNEYDLSVIKAAHLVVPQDKIAADRKLFLARLRGLYPRQPSFLFPDRKPFGRLKVFRKVTFLNS